MTVWLLEYLGARVNKQQDEVADNYARTFNLQLVKAQDLRYGENPHQTAAFYVESTATSLSVYCHSTSR